MPCFDHTRSVPSPWALVGAAGLGEGRRSSQTTGASKSLGTPILSRPAQGRVDTTTDISLTCPVVPPQPVWLWATGSASPNLVQSQELRCFPSPSLGVMKSPRSQPMCYPEGRKTDPGFPPKQPSGIYQGLPSSSGKSPCVHGGCGPVPHARQAGVCLVGTLP